MVRKLSWAASLIASLYLFAGCGHDGTVSATLPGDLPPEPDGVRGGVLAPNGVFAQSDSWLWRFASWIEGPAYALAPNVIPIGPGTSVTLYIVFEDDVNDGQIDDAMAVSAPDLTDNGGRFECKLLDGHSVGECGLLLSVGRGSTLTRALVYTDDQDLDAVGEAVVRSILGYIADHTNVRLCNYSTDEIEQLTLTVAALSEDTTGTSVADINARVEQIADASPVVQQLLAQFAAP